MECSASVFPDSYNLGLSQFRVYRLSLGKRVIEPRSDLRAGEMWPKVRLFYNNNKTTMTL